MKDLREVLRISMFETQNGYTKESEAIGNIEEYVDRNFLQLENVNLIGIKEMPVLDIDKMANVLGICFPVHDGSPTIMKN